ncbi:MAG: SCO1664 family protein [Acidimicrobiales bacterium]
MSEIRIEVPDPPREPAAVRRLLSCGAIDVRGRMPWSSNGTFLVEVADAGERALAVYKPERGERPLWDFPPGLWRREVAAYRLSEWLGWGLVPCTMPRSDAPLGIGSVQLFVPFDADAQYFTLLDDERHHPTLKRVAAFDVVANSTDRKGGHFLLDEAGRVWVIDNGLAFHAEFKLRTVVWEFGGERVPDDVLADVERLVATGLPGELRELLDPFERDALVTRARALVKAGRFPTDPSERRYPWPLV